MTIGAILAGRDGTIFSCTASERVGDVAARLAEHRIGALPVVDGDGVVGIFSERDLVYCIAQRGAAALDLPVADVMTSPVVSTDPDTPVMVALSLMTRRRIRHLPVLRDGRLTGFVSIGDLVKHRIDRIESEAAAMRDYIGGA